MTRGADGARGGVQPPGARGRQRAQASLGVSGLQQAERGPEVRVVRGAAAEAALASSHGAQQVRRHGEHGGQLAGALQPRHLQREAVQGGEERGGPVLGHGEDIGNGEYIGGEEAAAETEHVMEEEATNEDAMEAARTTMPCAAVEDIIISARRLSLQHPTLDSVDPATRITWPALAPQFLYPSKSEMRSWPWPTSKSPPPQAENDDSDKESNLETGENEEKRKQIDDSDSDKEESPYEKLMWQNVQDRQRKFAALEIESAAAIVKKPRAKKPRAKKSKISSEEPVRKSRRIANKSPENVTVAARGEVEAENDSMGL